MRNDKHDPQQAGQTQPEGNAAPTRTGGKPTLAGQGAPERSTENGNPPAAGGPQGSESRAATLRARPEPEQGYSSPDTKRGSTGGAGAASHVSEHPEAGSDED